MEKNIVEIERLKENFTVLKTKSGLTIFLKPMQNFSKSVAVFCTKFGSVDRKFKKRNENEFSTVPDGVAHYLEHKLFENEDGSITFELYAKEKALANAGTSFDKTSYYFSSPPETFINALKILLDLVQKPYFTDENVEKERGIIGQEINMGEDDPFWKTFFGCLKGLYHNSPIKIRIDGSIESTAKIDKKTLYDCYECFYNPNNMALILVGNFKEEEVLSLLKKELKEKDPIFVDRFVESEPEDIVEKLSIMKMSVKTPIFAIGFKISPKKAEEVLKFKIGFKILYEILFGEGSFLYDLFYKKGLVVGVELDWELLVGENYFTMILMGESENPREVLDEISREIEDKKRNGIDKKQFELVKKIVYKELVEQFSKPEKLASFMSNCFIENVDICTKVELIANVKFEDVLDCLKEIDLNRINLTITESYNN